MKRNCIGVLLAVTLIVTGCSNSNTPDNTPTAVEFSELTANGTSTSVTSSELTLTFSVDPKSLTASDIIVTGATKGELTGTGTTRTLAISDIKVDNGEDITLILGNPAGFTITPAIKTVAVNVAEFSTSVEFSALTANGTPAVATTTQLTLTFSVDPTSLSASVITVTGAAKGEFTGTGTTRTLAISKITVADGENITVAVANSAGFTFNPASKTVAVNVAASLTPVEFIALTANGESASVSTTQLTLTFSADPTSLTASDIIVTGATKGELTGTGSIRLLAISGIMGGNGATIIVDLSNAATYTFTPRSKTVEAYLKQYAIGAIGPSGVGTVFYVTDGGFHGLEVAPNLWKDGNPDPRVQWKTTHTETPGTEGLAIGTGYQNTAAMTGEWELHPTDPAATACVGYSGGAKNDWFLPSYNELKEMYLQRGKIDGLQVDKYWSSSQYKPASSGAALCQNFSDGMVNGKLNDEEAYVRPIRAF